MFEQEPISARTGTGGERRNPYEGWVPTISTTVRSVDVPGVEPEVPPRIDPVSVKLGPDRRAERRVVYFIRGVGVGLVKIGVANCVHKRLRDIGYVCPVDLELLGVIEIPGKSRLEGQLHRRFADLRVRGEWFRETPDLLDFIASEAVMPRSPRRPTLLERKQLAAVRRAKRRLSEARRVASDTHTD